jgi:hypothetical protein
MSMNWEIQYKTITYSVILLDVAIPAVGFTTATLSVLQLYPEMEWD